MIKGAAAVSLLGLVTTAGMVTAYYLGTRSKDSDSKDLKNLDGKPSSSSENLNKPDGTPPSVDPKKLDSKLSASSEASQKSGGKPSSKDHTKLDGKLSASSEASQKSGGKPSSKDPTKLESKPSSSSENHNKPDGPPLPGTTPASPGGGENSSLPKAEEKNAQGDQGKNLEPTGEDTKKEPGTPQDQNQSEGSKANESVNKSTIPRRKDAPKNAAKPDPPRSENSLSEHISDPESEQETPANK
eukprot:GHVT01017148.1.p1 GENE.GHVT01017148.1~~GHVT01017148.1.p1  ORF type:complete len:243 (-),score=47.65 GHVT01017148.1:1228-1956(-)